MDYGPLAVEAGTWMKQPHRVLLSSLFVGAVGPRSAFFGNRLLRSGCYSNVLYRPTPDYGGQ